MMYSFSEKYINETKEKLALEVLKLVGINNFDEKKYIIYNDLQSPETLEKIKNMIPALKTVFQISKNRCLSINSWQKSKHPGVNLLRQILKEVGYKLSLINEFQGTVCAENGNKKKVYNTKYIIIPYANTNKNFTPNIEAYEQNLNENNQLEHNNQQQLNQQQLNPQQLNSQQLNPQQLNPQQLNPQQLNPQQLNPQQSNNQYQQYQSFQPSQNFVNHTLNII